MSSESQRYSFTIDEERAALGLVKAVAFVKGREPTQIGPLVDVIDTDALNTLISESDNVTVSFTWDGLEIEVTADGDIIVANPNPSTDTHRSDEPPLTFNEPETTARPTGDHVEPVLAAQQVRMLRALLDDVSKTADPILHHDETLASEQYVTVCYELHHILLPELEMLGLIEFDRSNNEITRGPEYDDVRPLLKQIDESKDIIEAYLN